MRTLWALGVVSLLVLACGSSSGKHAPMRYNDGGEGGGGAEGGTGTVVSQGGEPSAEPTAGAGGCGPEGCGCFMVNQLIQSEVLGGFSPTAIVWNGDGYGMAWGAPAVAGEPPEIYFNRLDPQGLPLGQPTRITEAAGLSLVPVLVWTGSEYGLAWNDQRDNATESGDAEIYFARINADGAKIGDDVRVSNAPGQSYRPSMVHSGATFTITWNDNRSGLQQIMFAQLDALGQPASEELDVSTTTGSALFSAVTATDDGFAVVWNQNENDVLQLQLATLDAAGAVIAGPTPVTEALGSSYSGAIAWSGSELGVTWTHEVDGDMADPEIFFARFSPDGSKVGQDVRLRNAAGTCDQSTVVWNGSEFAVAWRDDRNDPTNGDIYYLQVDDAPATARNLTLTMAATNSTAPTLVATDAEPALGFHVIVEMGNGDEVAGETRFTLICDE